MFKIPLYNIGSCQAAEFGAVIELVTLNSSTYRLKAYPFASPEIEYLVRSF